MNNKAGLLFKSTRKTMAGVAVFSGMEQPKELLLVLSAEHRNLPLSMGVSIAERLDYSLSSGGIVGTVLY